MKRKDRIHFLTIPLALLITLQSTAQALYEVSLDEKIQHSTLIVEGKVVSQQCFWNTGHTMIFTNNRIELYKIFKGTVQTDFIEVLTQGGSIGLESIEASDLAVLDKEQIGTFFCYPNSIDLRSPSTGKLLFDLYSSSQGSLKYDESTKTVNAPFVRIKNIETELYQTLRQKTGQAYRTIKPYSINAYNATLRPQVVSITGFSPTTVNAGATINVITNELTITGTGFGTASGSAKVQFDDANDGSGGAFYDVPFNDPLMVSWSATSIVVKVPSRAGTGVIKVFDNTGVSGTSAATLNVNYSILTSTLTSGTSVTKESNLMNTNAAGGYSIRYSKSTAGGGVNLNTAPEKTTFTRALTTWKEAAGFNVIDGSGDAMSTAQVVSGADSNVIMFDNTNTGVGVLASGVLAVCYSFSSMCLPLATNQIQKTGFDIVIRNTGVSSGSTTFTSGPCPPASSSFSDIDLETVLLHELGHALGLGHINDTYQGSFLPNINPGKLMNFAVVNGVKRSSPDNSAYTGALYTCTPQGNTYGSCGLFSSEMTQLSTTTESKDDCPSFPSTSLPNNTSVHFDLVHATSNKAVDPQYTAMDCSAAGTAVTNTAFYAFKTGAFAGSLSLTVSGYATTPAAQSACSSAGVELLVYAVSSCPAGQAFPAPSFCRTFNANGALTALAGLTANTTYLVVVDGVDNTKATFDLLFSGALLPIKIKTFTGEKLANYNRLKWEIDYMADVRNIVLERSNDGIQFTPIYTMNGSIILMNGSFNDVRPFIGNNFYRLATENNNGNVEYSNIILLTRDDKFLVSVFPNPATTVIKVELKALTTGKYSFALFNNIGQLMMQRSEYISSTQQVIDIPVKQFAKGTYLLKVLNDKNELLRSTAVILQ